MPKLSIIVPIYNADQTLSRCLLSLMNQTLKDIEIICIDDKSSDNSLSILRSYEKRDSRIKVIALAQNSGVSMTRNNGMEVATGEYIGFVDSDDYVDLDFYEKLHDVAVATNADISKGEIIEINTQNESCVFGPTTESIKSNRYCFSYAWTSAIYRREMLNQHNCVFDHTLYGEDTTFLLQAVFFANHIELVPDAYYFYIRQENSLDSGIFNTEKVKQLIASTKMKLDFCNSYVHETQTYVFIYQIWFNNLLVHIHQANTKKSQLIMAQALIELWQKCKFKDDICTQRQYQHWLRKGNAVQLLKTILNKKNFFLKLAELFFSITNINGFKVITIFGIKIKFRKSR